MMITLIVTAWSFIFVDCTFEPFPKRTRKSNTISFYVENINDVIRIGIRQEHLKKTNSFMIAGLTVDGNNSYYSTTDLAIKNAMIYLEASLLPENKEIDGLLLDMDAFLQSARLHERLMAKSFTDLSCMCLQKCYDDRNYSNLLIQLECITKLEQYMMSDIDRVNAGEFQIFQSCLGEDFLSWTLLGFWKSFLKQAIKQQMSYLMERQESQIIEENARVMQGLYEAHQGMVSMIDVIWERMSVHDFGATENAAALLIEWYSVLERILINLNIEDAIRLWRRDHDGSIAVLMKEPPMEFLKDDLRDMGYGEADISMHTHVLMSSL